MGTYGNDIKVKIVVSDESNQQAEAEVMTYWDKKLSLREILDDLKTVITNPEPEPDGG